MKSTVKLTLWALLGIGTGYFFASSSAEVKREKAKAPTKRERREISSPVRPLTTAGLAKMAEGIVVSDFPSFFEAQLHSPEGRKLAERLWAEADPQGYWEWLKQQHDADTLRRYGEALVCTWATQDPESAMRAVNQVTDKESSDLLRRCLIETLLARDIEKAVAFAAATPDFNAFSYSSKAIWRGEDATKAAKALASLPIKSEFRSYLENAVRSWAEYDPASLRAWLKSQKSGHYEKWYAEAFTELAKKDLPSTLDAALSLTDADTRDQAISGIIGSGVVPAKDQVQLQAETSIGAREAGFGKALWQSSTRKNPELDPDQLKFAPTSRNLLSSIQGLASSLANTDATESLNLVNQLPDSSMRRVVLSRMVDNYRNNPDQLAQIASQEDTLNLSNDFFVRVLDPMDESQRKAWLAKLPAERAEWARTAIAGKMTR